MSVCPSLSPTWEGDWGFNAESSVEHNLIFIVTLTLRFKVSNTCYDVHSKKVSGYGRAIRNISVSPDCPNSFFRTEHIIRPKDFTPAPKEIASRKAGVEASYVLPGGSSFSEQPLKGRRYTKLYTNNQVCTS